MKGILPFLLQNSFLLDTWKIMTITILQLQQNGNQPGHSFVSGKEVKHLIPLIVFHESRQMNYEYYRM